MSKKQSNPCPYTYEETISFRNSLGKPPAPPPIPVKKVEKCSACGGLGWVEADVGVVYECYQCNKGMCCE